MFGEEVITLAGDIEEIVFPVRGVVECGKHVDYAPLHPHIFRRVVHRAVAVEHGEISAVGFVFAVLFPEWNDGVDQFILISGDNRINTHDTP